MVSTLWNLAAFASKMAFTEHICFRGKWIKGWDKDEKHTQQGWSVNTVFWERELKQVWLRDLQCDVWGWVRSSQTGKLCLAEDAATRSKVALTSQLNWWWRKVLRFHVYQQQGSKLLLYRMNYLVLFSILSRLSGKLLWFSRYSQSQSQSLRPHASTAPNWCFWGNSCLVPQI